MDKKYINAKEKVRNIKVFYIHFVGYLILVALLLYNIYILEGEHKDFFLWFNLTVIVSWTIFIVFHAWYVFKGKLFFKKSWEEKKMKEFLDREEEVEMWE